MSRLRTGSSSRLLGGLPGWLLGTVGLAAVLAVYFAVPVHSGQSMTRVVAGTTVTLLGVAAVGLVTLREERLRHAGVPGRLTVLRLLLLLEVVMVLFSLAYYHLAVDTTGELTGIHTRVDALYFTVTIMTTVGFGDVHPVGQLSRALVTAHMAFDVAFIAAFAGLYRSSLTRRPHEPDES
jgi:voltage-gated potassium channel